MQEHQDIRFKQDETVKCGTCLWWLSFLSTFFCIILYLMCPSVKNVPRMIPRLCFMPAVQTQASLLLRRIRLSKELIDFTLLVNKFLLHQILHSLFPKVDSSKVSSVDTSIILLHPFLSHKSELKYGPKLTRLFLSSKFLQNL